MTKRLRETLSWTLCYRLISKQIPTRWLMRLRARVGSGTKGTTRQMDLLCSNLRGGFTHAFSSKGWFEIFQASVWGNLPCLSMFCATGPIYWNHSSEQGQWFWCHHRYALQSSRWSSKLAVCTRNPQKHPETIISDTKVVSKLFLGVQFICWKSSIWAAQRSLWRNRTWTSRAQRLGKTCKDTPHTHTHNLRISPSNHGTGYNQIRFLAFEKQENVW